MENVAWIEEIRTQATRDIELADGEPALEEIRVRYLGRSGRITRAFRDVAAAPAEERPRLGQAINQLKDYVELALARRREVLGQAARATLAAAERIDVTLPGRPLAHGRAHVLARTAREITEIFRGMGFDVEDGPEIESDHDNFERLNIPPYHPARDAQDSFYIDNTWLLRPHTTVVDVHVMDGRRPPMRAVTSGHCYRRDPVDASHSPMFQQIDGFMVDDGVRLADLKGVLYEFARGYFGAETRVRFVPSYFPFTEPSAGMDIGCVICGGRGCAVCKRSGWLEILGCGMFHPRVLEMARIDPERYTAFAFGIGLERCAMLKHRIDDIRLFYEGDVRFLRQV
ncbi:MAG TPA: phenylalanine--tRNA ligase subunit alpha [bacterium]|nr:phenylalanine--tRNA ligase subunit alpha [bacterium]